MCVLDVAVESHAALAAHKHRIGLNIYNMATGRPSALDLPTWARISACRNCHVLQMFSLLPFLLFSFQLIWLSYWYSQSVCVCVCVCVNPAISPVCSSWASLPICCLLYATGLFHMHNAFVFQHFISALWAIKTCHLFSTTTLVFLDRLFHAFCINGSRNEYSTVYLLNGLMTL